MNKLFIFCTFSLLMSCSAIVNSYMKSMGIYDNEVKFEKMQNHEKEVIFIPNRHMGTPVYYKNLKLAIDSLTNDGYFIFYESIKPDVLENSDDTLQLMQQALKLRKALGSSLSNISSDGGIFDTINHTMKVGKREIKLKEKIIMEPSAEKKGLVNNPNAENTDVTLGAILNEYEKRFGEIILTDCDFNTPMNEPYHCENENAAEDRKKIYNEIIIDFRNQNLVNEVLESDKNKIVVIYGSNHIKGMKELLEQKDYQEVN